MKVDFIVIGSGLAGLTCSLILSKYGEVLLVTKRKLSDCATNFAQGGMAAAVGKDDSFESHIKDTLEAGCFHNNKKAVEFMVRASPTAVDWLMKQGVSFAKEGGKFSLGREAAHSFPRILHASDFTGREIEKTLVRRVKNLKNIEIRENTFAVDLLDKDNTCFGVRVIKDRQLINILSRATILATGGLGQIYQWTTNPKVVTGDGIAMAYRAGAKLDDMEFIQFHPTALKHGKSPLFLLSESLRGEGALLVRTKNKKGERFMGEYDQRMELAPRDIVARAIFREQQKGFEIFLDIRHRGKRFLQERFPNIYRELRSRGFDLSRDLIPVTPAAHYSCGGVKTDLYGRTNIKNLFAFGEVACTRVHGANRLASNSLLEAVVFPLQISKVIPAKSMMIRIIEPNKKRYLTDNRSIVKNIRDIQKKLQELMWEKVGIIRTREGLLEAKEKIEELEKELSTFKTITIESLGLKNMLQAASSIVNSALNRPKSLGAHFMV